MFVLWNLPDPVEIAARTISQDRAADFYIAYRMVKTALAWVTVPEPPRLEFTVTVVGATSTAGVTLVF